MVVEDEEEEGGGDHSRCQRVEQWVENLGHHHHHDHDYDLKHSYANIHVIRR